MNHLYTTLLGLLSLSTLHAQNVGIGTTNPSEKLHVVGNARITALGGSGNALVLSNNNGILSTRALSGNATDVLVGTGNFVPIASLNDDDWQVSGNNLLSIPTGNVGIGTTAPQSKLQVGSGIAGGYRTWMQNGFIAGDETDGIYVGVKREGADRADAVIAWGDNPDESLRFIHTLSGGGTTFAERMRLTSAGNLGIGVTNPAERLVVYRDQDISSEIGRAHIGHMGHGDWAGFSHIDANGTGSYALLQNTAGRTLLNAASGQTITLRQNNTDQVQLEADGDLAMVNGNSFKQPNNVRHVKRTNTQSHNNNDNWWYITANTNNINVEPGNIIKLEATFMTRLSGGSGVDEYDYKVYSTGTCGAGDHNVVDGYRPDETGNDNHDNFKPISYLDYYVVPNCTGTMSFRLELRNRGDDSYQAKDAVLFITKY
ncbi:MAG: hypothetical protein AB8E82_15665 [Aureispira sp.]